MITILEDNTIVGCDNCKYDNAFILCDMHHRWLENFKPANRQYDELYKDCSSEVQLYPCMVPLGNRIGAPTALNEYTDFDESKFFAPRSDIPAPQFFVENIKKLKGYMLQPEETKHMLAALKSPEYALASFEFNETFETQYCPTSISNPKFKEDYDMIVVDEIIELAKKIKKITRIS